MVVFPTRHGPTARVPIVQVVMTVHETALRFVGNVVMAIPLMEGKIRVKVRAKRPHAGETGDPGAGARPVPTVSRFPRDKWFPTERETARDPQRR